MLTNSLVLICLASLAYADEKPVSADIVFRGGIVVDGTGAPRRQADVAVKGDRIIAVGKFAPYNIQIFDVDESTIDEGRREYRRNLALIIQCIREGNWPGYPQEIQKLKMRTPYRVKRLENEA